MKETDDLRSEGEAYVSPSRRSSTGTDGPLRQGPTSGGSFVEQDGRVAVAQVATLDLGGQLEVLDEFRGKRQGCHGQGGIFWSRHRRCWDKSPTRAFEDIHAADSVLVLHFILQPTSLMAPVATLLGRIHAICESSVDAERTRARCDGRHSFVAAPEEQLR